MTPTAGGAIAAGALRLVGPVTEARARHVVERGSRAERQYERRDVEEPAPPVVPVNRRRSDESVRTLFGP